jgi:hypothetical protein
MDPNLQRAPGRTKMDRNRASACFAIDETGYRPILTQEENDSTASTI